MHRLGFTARIALATLPLWLADLYLWHVPGPYQAAISSQAVHTVEHACFVGDLKKFEQLDAQVLGVSVDSVWSHKAFAEKTGITYPLLADFHPRGAMADKYGLYLADKGITGRAIAIVNKAGSVAWLKQYDIPQVPDLAEVAQALAGVKSATA